MKLIIGKFPDDKSFNPVEGNWKPIKEPTNLWLVQLLAIPFLILNLLVVFIGVSLLSIKMDIPFDWRLLLAFIIIVPIHEFIHAAVFPGGPFSRDVYYGIMPKQLAFFAFYPKEMSRNRFLLTLIMPYITFTIVGLVILKFVGNNVLISDIIIVNALAACGDTFGFTCTLFQIPRRALVRNKGMRTFWRPASYNDKLSQEL